MEIIVFCVVCGAFFYMSHVMLKNSEKRRREKDAAVKE